MTNNRLLFILLLLIFKAAPAQEEVRIGILTDVQYCDCPASGVRYYRLSLSKLDTCISVFNSLQLNAVFHLGDITDRYAESLDSILPRFSKFRAPVNQVLGNHEFMISKEVRPTVPKRIGLKESYYFVDIGSWRMIVLNGNDLSFMAPQTRQQRKERNQMVLNNYERLRFSGWPWNGGVGSIQMQWLADRLAEADSTKKKVVVMCHFPLKGGGDHVLFNNVEMLALLGRHESVKAYFCGHWHEGSYRDHNGIHLVNFKGMVNETRTAFAEVVLSNDSIIINGYGREISRQLRIR